jgi:hypothetical protein
MHSISAGLSLVYKQTEIQISVAVDDEIAERTKSKLICYARPVD